MDKGNRIKCGGLDKGMGWREIKGIISSVTE